MENSIGNIILYFCMALSTVVFSVLAVKSRRILRAATYLLFVLISVSVFYFQLGYQFLGAVQLAVYAGGIMVLFVFAILLTTQPGDKASLLEAHRKTIGVTAAIVGAGFLLYALFSMPLFTQSASLASVISGNTPISMRTIGETLIGSGRFQYLLPFEAVSVLLLSCIIGAIVIARKENK